MPTSTSKELIGYTFRTLEEQKRISIRECKTKIFGDVTEFKDKYIKDMFDCLKRNLSEVVKKNIESNRAYRSESTYINDVFLSDKLSLETYFEDIFQIIKEDIVIWISERVNKNNDNIYVLREEPDSIRASLKAEFKVWKDMSKEKPIDIW